MKFLNMLSGMVLGGFVVGIILAIIDITLRVVMFIYIASGENTLKTAVTVLMLLGIVVGGIVGLKVNE